MVSEPGTISQISKYWTCIILIMLTPPYCAQQHIQTHCSLKVCTFLPITISVSSLSESSMCHCCAFLHDKYNLIYTLNSANFQTVFTKFLFPPSLYHQATNRSQLGTSVHYLCTHGTQNSTAHQFIIFNHMPWVNNKYYTTKTLQNKQNFQICGKKHLQLWS
jgi:hypothetical protein